MKQKIAIIDPLGAHGRSHHFYLFGQAKGLINCGVDVCLYTNKETKNPKINGLKFFTFYGNLFSSSFKTISGIKYILGSIFSVFHARISGYKIFHFHVFYTNFFMFFNVLFSKLLFGKVVLTIHDVSSFVGDKESSTIIKWIYKFTDLILTHNEFSKTEILKISSFYSPKLNIDFLNVTQLYIYIYYFQLHPSICVISKIKLDIKLLLHVIFIALHCFYFPCAKL